MIKLKVKKCCKNCIHDAEDYPSSICDECASINNPKYYMWEHKKPLIKNKHSITHDDYIQCNEDILKDYDIEKVIQELEDMIYHPSLKTGLSIESISFMLLILNELRKEKDNNISEFKQFDITKTMNTLKGVD